MTTKLSRALEAINHGLAVFPLHHVDDGRCSCRNPSCTSPGKHPLGDLVQNGVKAATKDKEQALDWWMQREHANVGVATGAVSGVDVLDVDPKSGGNESLARLVEEFGPLPETWVVTTGGGGAHYYFRRPAGASLRNRAGIRPGLDWRGDGGYVVYPGSTHLSGSVYAWAKEPNGSSASDPPAWLVTTATERWTRADQLGGSDPETGITEGSRNDSLARLAGFLRAKSLSEDAILAVLLVENQKRCTPPLPEFEVRGIARSISRYEPGQTLVAASSNASPDRFTSIALAADDFLEKTYTMPKPLVAGGVVSAGDLVFLYGRPGLGKTWATLQLAVSLARGTEWYGLETSRGGARVGILELELHAHWLQDRLRVVAGDEGVPTSIQIVARPDLQGSVDVMDEGDWTALAHWCRSASLDVLIIDALSRAHDVDENAAHEFAPVLQRFDRIRHETGATVIVVHHEPKGPADKLGGRDDMDALRGTSRLASDANTLIRLVRWGEGEGKRTALRFPKVNNAPTPSPIYLAQRPDGVLDVTDPPEVTGKEVKEYNVAKVRVTLEEYGPEGVGREEIERRTGLGRETVRKHLRALNAERFGPEKSPRYRLRPEAGGGPQ